MYVKLFNCTYQIQAPFFILPKDQFPFRPDFIRWSYVKTSIRSKGNSGTSQNSEWRHGTTERNKNAIKMLRTCIIQGGNTTEPTQVWSTASLHHTAYVKDSHQQILTETFQSRPGCFSFRAIKWLRQQKTSTSSTATLRWLIFRKSSTTVKQALALESQSQNEFEVKIQQSKN